MTEVNDSGIYLLSISGEDIALRFGMPANRMIFARLLEYPDMLSGDKLNEQGIAFLIYAGYINACMAQDKAPSRSFEYFYEFVEDNIDNEKQFVEIAECYANSRHTKKQVDKVNAATEEIKKKTLTGMVSNPSVTESSA